MGDIKDESGGEILDQSGAEAITDETGVSEFGESSAQFWRLYDSRRQRSVRRRRMPGVYQVKNVWGRLAEIQFGQIAMVKPRNKVKVKKV